MTDNLRKSIVKTIIDEGTNNTTSSNWIYPFDTFEMKYGVKPTDDIIEDLVMALSESDVVLDVEREADCLSIIFAGDACPNLEE